MRFIDQDGFAWAWCSFCGVSYVKCGWCGANGCISFKQCDMCKHALFHQRIYLEAGKEPTESQILGEEELEKDGKGHKTI